MTDDEKIEAFEKHILDRQLVIAKHLASRFVADTPGDPLSQSGFAILSIVTNYFEMIEQFSVGASSHRNSGVFFRDGMARVFPTTEVTPTDADRLYSFMRCGMYHSAMPTDRCGISRELHVPIFNDGGVILINPALLVDQLIAHFSTYCSQIRGSSNPTLRQNMLNLFGLLDTQAPTSTHTANQTQIGTTPPPWQH
jgi:hypothetical protein